MRHPQAAWASPVLWGGKRLRYQRFLTSPTSVWNGGTFPVFKLYFYVSFNYMWPKWVGWKDSDRYLVLFKQQHWLQSTATPHSCHSFPWDRQHVQHAQHLGNAAEKGQFLNHILFLSPSPLQPDTHPKSEFLQIHQLKQYIRRETRDTSENTKL